MTESVSNRKEIANDRICDHTWTSVDGRVSDFRHYLLYALPDLTPYTFCPMCGEKL